MKRLIQLCLVSLACLSGHAASTEQRDLAREVIRLLDAEKMLEAVTPQLQQMMSQMMAPMMKQYGFSSEESARLSKVQEEIMDISMEMVRKLVPEVERAYAETYTTEELRAMKLFFSTLEGQAMLKKQPDLMKKLAPSMQDAILANQPKIQMIIQRETNRIVADRKAKGG